MKQQLQAAWILMAGSLLSVGAIPMSAQQGPATPQAAPAAQAPASPAAMPQTAAPMKMLDDAQPSSAALPVAAAATTTPSSPQSAPPELKLSPEKMLQEFEPGANEEYELGPGDEISLDFAGRPELSSKKVVGPDGRITLDLAGPIDVSNKTRAQVAKLIVDALAPYYKDLSVTVSVDKYGSNRIVVIGNVVHPGVIYFDDTPTLLDVIARAGMMPSTHGAESVSSGASSGPNAAPSDGIPERCAIYRGNDQVVWIDLRALLTSGSTLADMRLKRNDIVYIPAQQEVFVSVLGNVAHPGAIALTPQSTLTSVLAQAGGLAEGSSASIQIIQPSTGKSVNVSFKSLLTVKGTDEVKLRPGDVIFVPQSGFYKATYVVQRLSPIASIGMIAAYATGVP